MPDFSQFIVPSSLFTSNLSSMITIRMSMVITLLQFRLSLLFFVLFYRIMSVFTECIHPETKIAVFSYTVTYAKLSVYSKPDLSLSIIRHAGASTLARNKNYYKPQKCGLFYVKFYLFLCCTELYFIFICDIMRYETQL